MATLASILVALFKAIPALESLVRMAVGQIDKAREAAAANRKTAKDTAVDEAIDRPPQS